MNKVILMGRLTRDPEVRYSQGEKSTAVARFGLAVNRSFHRDGDPEADFFNCVAFGRNAEFIEKYFHQGMRVCISGKIQTGSYTNRDGQNVRTTDIIIEEQEFAESKNERNSSSNSGGGNQNYGNGRGTGNSRNSGNSGNNSRNNGNSGGNYAPVNSGGYAPDGFMNIPEGIDDDLPFN